MRARQYVVLRCNNQHDSATVPAEQLGEEVLPEPLSNTKRQFQSCLDGGEEIHGTRRMLLEATAPDPQGHVVRQ